jgi:hypothetical protein
VSHFMDIDIFWNLINKSRRGSTECEELSEKLIDLLQKLELQEIQEFDRIMHERLIESYRWDLWAVAYIINGGCSDDGFEYFRGWLIAQGRDYFENALKSPESAAKRVKDEEAECEDILQTAQYAYERKIGQELPSIDINYPSEPIGKRWNEDELDKLYPKLWKRFS